MNRDKMYWSRVFATRVIALFLAAVVCFPLSIILAGAGFFFLAFLVFLVQEAPA